jgi:putative intracellular protease/amidase
VIIAIGLYQGFTALDAIGPYEVLTYLPDAEVVICAEHKGLVDDHNDLVHLRVDATFADVPPSFHGRACGVTRNFSPVARLT